jgi:hypothetical protein
LRGANADGEVPHRSQALENMTVQNRINEDGDSEEEEVHRSNHDVGDDDDDEDEEEDSEDREDERRELQAEINNILGRNVFDNENDMENSQTFLNPPRESNVREEHRLLYNTQNINN